MTSEANSSPRIKETAEEFWRDRCQDCAHTAHPLSPCGEIVGGFYEPDYCSCAGQLHAMWGEISRLRAAEAAEPAVALLRGLRVDDPDGKGCWCVPPHPEPDQHWPNCDAARRYLEGLA